MTSVERTKPRPATLHVDVGSALKQAVHLAASEAGVRPSDWVRDALQRALDTQGPAGMRPDAVSLDRATGKLNPWTRERPTEGFMSSAGRASIAVEHPAANPTRRRVTDIRLEPDDVALLDDVVKRAGFRSRAAALRYLLRVLAREAGGDAVDALALLPKTIPALTDSNVALQLWMAGPGAGCPESSAVSSLRSHLEAVARVVAALRPLLTIRPSTGARPL